MRNWTWALVLTLGAMAVWADAADAQLFRRGRVMYSSGYNTFYYPSYIGGYSYPSYTYSGYSYSPGVVYSSGVNYVTPRYGYGYTNYAYPGYYGTRGVSYYSSPWGTGVTVGGRGWGVSYGNFPRYGYAYPGYGYGYRGLGYGGRYWR